MHVYKKQTQNKIIFLLQNTDFRLIRVYNIAFSGESGDKSAQIKHCLQAKTVQNKHVTLKHKTSVKSLGYICSNSQKYIVWVKIIDFSFKPKVIRILDKDHVP